MTDEEKIKYLREQVKLMREMLEFLSKESGCGNVKLPPFVYEKF